MARDEDGGQEDSCVWLFLHRYIRAALYQQLIVIATRTVKVSISLCAKRLFQRIVHVFMNERRLSRDLTMRANLVTTRVKAIHATYD